MSYFCHIQESHGHHALATISGSATNPNINGLKGLIQNIGLGLVTWKDFKASVQHLTNHNSPHPCFFLGQINLCLFINSYRTGGVGIWQYTDYGVWSSYLDVASESFVPVCFKQRENCFDVSATDSRLSLVFCSLSRLENEIHTKTS